MRYLDGQSEVLAFSKILKYGGIFINADQIKGETPFLRKLYRDIWLKKIRMNGASKKKIEESVKRREKYDIDSSLKDQLKWLKNAGFRDVDCIYKNYFLGVFFARK